MKISNIELKITLAGSFERPSITFTDKGIAMTWYPDAAIRAIEAKESEIQEKLDEIKSICKGE